MSTAQDTGQEYALLADGTTFEIREAGPDDFGAVRAMYEAMAPDNIYMRLDTAATAPACCTGGPWNASSTAGCPARSLSSAGSPTCRHRRPYRA